MSQTDYLLIEIEIQQKQFEIQQHQVMLGDAFDKLITTCGLADTAIVKLPEPQLMKNNRVQELNSSNKFFADSSGAVWQQNLNNLKYKPRFSAFGNAGLNATDISNIDHHIGISAGFHLVVPIYDGGQKKFNDRQNDILIENLKYYRDQHVTQVQHQLASIEQQLTLTAEAINMLANQIATQQNLLELMQDKVISGQISVTDYLNALQNFSLAAQNKIQSQADLWLLVNQYNYLNW